MSEPIYIDDLRMQVVRLDESSAFVTVLANEVGIAGDVSLEMDVGVTVRTDFADPEKLVGIEFEVSQIDENAAERQLPLEMIDYLMTLIGSEACVEIERALVLRIEGVIPIRGGMGPLEHLEQWRGRGKGRDAVLLGRALHLLDIADDPEELAGVRVLAAIEALDFQLDGLPKVIQRNVIRAARERLTEMMGESRGRDSLDDPEADLRELSTISPSLVRRLKKLIEGSQTISSISSVDFRRKLLTVLDAESNTMQWQSPTVQVKDDGHQDEEMSDVAPQVHEVSPGRLILTWGTRPLGESVRVLTENELTLVAVAPIMPAESGWKAEVVVPLDLDPSRLLFGSVSEPFPVFSSSTFEQIMEAVNLGRAAVITTKSEVPRGVEVEQAWLRCAAAWERLGDVTRRDLAWDYSNRRTPTRERFISDEVRLLLEGSMIGRGRSSDG